MFAKVGLSVLFACGLLRGGQAADQYKARLAALDMLNPRSTCAGRDALREMVPVAPSLDRTSMYRSFAAMYQQIGEGSRAAFEQTFGPFQDRMYRLPGFRLGVSLSPLLRRIPEIRRAMATWLDCGFAIVYSGEGSFAAEFDPETGDEFVPFMPVETREWIAFDRAEYVKGRIVSDARLLLTWSQLVDRLIRWEMFEGQHPTLKPDLEPEIVFMARILFFGIDNTPIRDYKSGRIDPEVLAAWRRFMANSGQSRFKADMRRALGVVARNGGLFTDEVSAAVESVQPF